MRMGSNESGVGALQNLVPKAAHGLNDLHNVNGDHFVFI